VLFSAITLEHFRNAKFQGLHPQTDVVGMGGSFKTGRFAIIGLTCGDGRIKEARFRSFNCISVIAAANWVCQTLQNQDLKEASALSVEATLTALGGLPKSREFCAHLVHDALKSALEQAQKKGLLL
jgi:NifU-like protein